MDGFMDKNYKEYIYIYIYTHTHIHPSIHPLGADSVQSVGAAEAVSLAIEHNPGGVATPT